MSQVFSFEEEHAARYGVAEAVVLFHLRYWIEQNHSSGRNREEDRTWTYQSQRSLAVHFSFFSEDQIYRILSKLASESGPLLKGNFNATKYDRTVWYAFKNEEEWIRPKYFKEGNAFRENPESKTPSRAINPVPSRDQSRGVSGPIPDNKTDNKTSSSPKVLPSPVPLGLPLSSKERWRKRMIEKFGETFTDQQFEGAWKEYSSTPPSEIRSPEGYLGSLLDKWMMCSGEVPVFVDPEERERRIESHRQQAFELESEHVRPSEFAVYVKTERGTCPVPYDLEEDEWQRMTKGFRAMK